MPNIKLQNPGLTAFYNIWPENGVCLSSWPRSPAHSLMRACLWLCTVRI